MDIINFRIYGDNILECEKTLNLIFKGIRINADNTIRKSIDLHSTINCPTYRISVKGKLYKFQLFPGYARWSSNILDKLNQLGASLNEGADSIVTKIDGDKEDIVFGCEYCGALPAGNNAWQRSGRALLFAEANVPFLYYSELGGMELDDNRNIKAGRLPNPLIPYSYITINYNLPTTIISPIYIASPTISEENRALYNQGFIEKEDLQLIYNLLEGNYEECLKINKEIQEKALFITKLLIENRRTNDTIASSEIDLLTDKIIHNKSSEYFTAAACEWTKSITIDLTDSMTSLFDFCKSNCLSVGSNSLPFCMIKEDKKSQFIQFLNTNYSNYSSVINRVNNSSKPIALVWIAGFKPAGDDSRPDRGLLPLFKMLFGDEYTIISIIYGPMKRTTLNTLFRSPYSLGETNGLWRAIFTQSDFLIVDNYMARNASQQNKLILDINSTPISYTKLISYTPCSSIPRLGEDDVDTAIHSLFKTNIPFSLASPSLNSSTSEFIFEALCNPPGGDWSGIEFYDNLKKKIYRWSSLPRVSGEDKRPDHIIQFKDKLLIIESKLNKNDVENNIGPRLINYVKKLLQLPPISSKPLPSRNWSLNNGELINENDYEYISAIAYAERDEIIISSTEQLVAESGAMYSFNDENSLFKFANVDLIFSITFSTQAVLINALCKNEHIKSWFQEMVEVNQNIRFLIQNNFIEIKIS